ncbi:thiazolylpeptide-type bacteriocin [Streptomyces dangxiongensis]|uniref:Thiazolylpeptide-type bacteriocin n=1 Tax=Streptomyces dangxiongensis TaxID=1442032 RepID=A0A3G2JLT7_9ACTN|nr:thiazolylpeptide-type bacteriocin [Streptomyces dangxiongensis]AYN43363.1 thiazolylpeptide-type bacteriocin [Streptomyces dangxiongensis]
MNTVSVNSADIEQVFDSFDVTELEVLEISQGVALPEMGASGGKGGTSSSSSTCSSSTC